MVMKQGNLTTAYAIYGICTTINNTKLATCITCLNFVAVLFSMQLIITNNNYMYYSLYMYISHQIAGAT